MKRTSDTAFFGCPVCGKKPFVETFGVNSALAYCKGYGFHRHKKVSVSIPNERPSKLMKELSEKWNQMMYEQSRFLFNKNGNPYRDSFRTE